VKQWLYPKSLDSIISDWKGIHLLPEFLILFLN